MMIVKIDLEKAYDRINWKFLQYVLMRVGFNDSMGEFIMFIVTSVRMSVLWNGDILESFAPRRGLRQGDPLAPYLFVLCLDSLSQTIKAATYQKLWRPIRASRYGPDISHLMFADDLLLMGVATEKQGEIMSTVLAHFCKLIGQKVGVSESRLYVSKNVAVDRAQRISEKFGIPTTYDLGHYLGMPLIHSWVTTGTYNHLIDKMRHKLASWKGKLMSRASRNILIQSVTSTIPYYSMQTTLLPTSIVARMEQLNRAFYWGEFEGERKMHSGAWPITCRSKTTGGTRLKRLRQMNLALLAKLLWRLILDEDVLCVKVLKSKYGCPMRTSPSRQSTTYTWRSILAAIPTVLMGLTAASKQSLTHEDTDRRIEWTGAPNGLFSVSSAYATLIGEKDDPEQRCWQNIWSLKGPQRGNFLLWQC